MDDLFQDKLELLTLYYPAILAEVLTEFLTSCGGEIDETRALIDGKPRPAKRPAAAQRVLASFPIKKVRIEKDVPKSNGISTSKESHGGEAKKQRFVLKVITLNTPQDVRDHLYPYASLHLNFLPDAMSDRVLREFVEMRGKFNQLKFFLFGNQCELNHLTGLFSRPSAEYSRLVYNGQKQPKPFVYSKNMEEVARFTETFLNEQIIPKSERLKWQLPDPWATDFCVVNCYEKLQNNMDWHSDRLSHIGPHNYVASLSLGTTRMFRLRSTYLENGPIYQIPLPHNSLFIMRPGCQEEFKHCLNPMLKAVDVHPTLGTMRFGITARCYPTFFIENLPKCKCGVGMLLRRTYKSVATRGKYFWLCENIYQNKECGTFHWCDFTNVKGHYIAEREEDVSTWVAPEDTEKHAFELKEVR